MKNLHFYFKKTAFGSIILQMGCLLLSILSLNAQGVGGIQAPPNATCGVFKKLGGILDNNQGTVYNDRFGNVWSEAEILALNAGINGDCQAGIFDLKFSGNYTADEKAAVCVAFTYLSGEVGSGAPVNVVPLKIEFANGIGGAQASSFMTLECVSMKNFALVNIRTQTNQLPLNFFAGLIKVDQNINWYTGPPPANLADWNTNQVGKVDLVTAIIHEGLHILGMASTFGGVQLASGNFVEGFTDWDRYLYKMNGPNDYTKFIQQGTDPDCCGKQIKNPSAPAIFGDDCADNIMFRDGNTNIAEVSRVLPNANDIGGINNRLSHLDIACGPDEQYVMHPALPPSPQQYSYPRRELTQAERDILCRIGYPAAGSCTSCVVVTQEDHISEVIFLSGGNNPIGIGVSSTILANDVIPTGNFTFETFDVQPGITITPFNIIGGVPTELYIEGFFVGNLTFKYRITGCGGQVCDEAIVHVIVLQSPVVNCNNNDCDLVCFGDFEDLIPSFNTYHHQLALFPPPFHVLGSPANDNSVDIFIVDGTTNALGWQNGGFNVSHECPRIPLNQPIQPGCTATIRLSAAAIAQDGNPNQQPTIGVFGISAPPCSEILPLNCQNSQFILCAAPNVVNGVCLTSQAFPSELYGIPINPSLGDILPTSVPQVTGVDWEEYTFAWENQSSFPITDILLWGFTQNGVIENYAYYIDNLSVTSSCNTQIQITPKILSQCIGGQAVIQYDVCLLGSGQNPVAINLQAELPFGLTAVSGGGFDANGLATFSLVPGMECNGGANTTTITLTMNVSPNFDPLQAPIPVEVPLEFVGSGLCIDPATGGGGDVTLMLQDCSVPAASCHCPPNTGYEVGINMDSENRLSMSSLPPVLENTCLTVNGRLILDRDYQVNNCTIIMNRGAEIIITKKAGVQLFDNLIEGCDHLWRSITVFGGLHAEGNTIRDAQWAVRAENKSNIWVMDNYFESDYLAFYVPDAPTGVNTVNAIRLQRNEITCPNPLKPAYTVTGNADHQQVPLPGARTFAGAYLNDVSGFDLSFDNVMDGIRNGVVADHSVFTMTQCTVKNLINYLYPQGQAPGGAFNFGLYGVRATDCPMASVKDCEMFGVHHGVRAERSNLVVQDNHINADLQFNLSDPDESFAAAVKADFGTNRSATIQGNTIESCAEGITAYQWTPAANLLIYDNQIQLSACGQSLEFSGIALINCRRGQVSDNSVKPQTPGTGTGINMGSCQDVFVHNNTLYDLATGETGSSNVNCYFLGNTAASDVANGSAVGAAAQGFVNYFSDNPYCCNTVDALSGTGFLFDGPSTGSSFKYSQIKGAAMGLLLNESADISPQTHAKNRWFAGNGGAFHASDDPNFIFLSQFICVPALIPPFATAADQPGMPGVPWFVPQGSSPHPPDPNCACAYPERPGGEGALPRVTPGGDYLAAINGYQLAQYSDAYNWMTQQRLYERLRQAPELASTSVYISAFYQSAEINLIGQYDAVKHGMRDLIGRNDYSREVIGQSIERLNTLSEELRLLRQDPAATELRQRIKAHQLSQEVGRYKSYLKAVEQQQANEIGTLLNANTVLSANTVPQANERTLNRVILENHLWEGSSIATADVTALNLIAAQCPLSGGFAVYQARGLLTAIGEGENWEDNNLCSPAGAERGQESSQSKMTSVLFSYPNPSSQSVTISGFDLDGFEKTLELFSAAGKKVLSVTVSANQSSVEISTRQLSNGLYLYRTNAPNKTYQPGKIAVAH